MSHKNSPIALLIQLVLRISKCYNFHPIWAKIYEDNGYCRQIKILFLALLSFLDNNFLALLFVALGQGVNIFCHFWNLNMRANGKILKCAISWKWLIKEGRGQNLGTCRHKNYTCKVLFMSDFHCSDFQKATAPTISIQFQQHCMGNMVIRGNAGCYYWGDMPKFKKNQCCFFTLNIPGKSPELHCH